MVLIELMNISSLVSQWTFLLASAEWIDCIHLNLTNSSENISELLSWQISFKKFCQVSNQTMSFENFTG